jgi:rhomboid-like protein
MYNFRQDTLTPVVKNIIIINVLFVLLQFVLGQKGIDLADYLALHYWRSPNFGWWQLFTHMFMHGSAFDIKLTIGHIFFNMFGLFMFGGVLEQLWGPKRFLLFYLICGCRWCSPFARYGGFIHAFASDWGSGSYKINEWRR